jgi:3-hydroxymyristoyl/3-hydroxydecanoyl-(acyl carrier protein) dehydratase
MSDHFAAFSFVDRITDLVPGQRARGTFAVPSAVAAFPPCLMAEAVGQLAAWVSMSKIRFRGRPVAALATETRFIRAAQPGDTLELAVEIDDCDDDAVAYRGHADIAGTRAIELVDCLGPMLPLADFDDPAAMSARFELLASKGAAPNRFLGVELPRVTRDVAVGKIAAQGVLEVPETAPFFNDHFPRRAVFPATLMLDAQIDLALALAAQSGHWRNGAKLAPSRMTHVKVRSFTAPGTHLTLKAEMRPPSNGDATFMLTAESDGKTVATSRVVIEEMSQ